MIEEAILSGLIESEEYLRRVIPHIKEEYFEEISHRKIFGYTQNYVEEYNVPPSRKALKLMTRDDATLNEDTFKKVDSLIDSLEYDVTSAEFLYDKTEKFCQDRSLYLAMQTSIMVIDGEEKTMDVGAIPKLLSDALAVSFDNSIGHDFLEDAEDRFEFYHRKSDKIPFDIDLLNKITRGGFEKKTLNVFMASTGVGKSLIMCHMAANNLSQGRNVLYITLEMAEEKIAQRIDENRLDLNVDDLLRLNKEDYLKRLDVIKANTSGKLIIKEYPPASAGSSHFRYLLNELKMKKGFLPDVIYIDYLNICMSSRLKNNRNSMYEYIKAVAEEIRGLGVEFNVPIISATQVNRAGHENSEVGLENVSESWGLPATVDFMAVMISSDELAGLDQIMIKQLKNRYNALDYYNKFIIGVDKSKMTCYDIDDVGQEDILPPPNQKSDSLSVQATPNRPRYEGFK